MLVGMALGRMIVFCLGVAVLVQGHGLGTSLRWLTVRRLTSAVLRLGLMEDPRLNLATVERPRLDLATRELAKANYRIGFRSLHCFPFHKKSFSLALDDPTTANRYRYNSLVIYVIRS